MGLDNTDCDDSVLTDIQETPKCDELDNDCDGQVDDADDDVSEDSKSNFYIYNDSDGYRSKDLNEITRACAAPEGYAANNDDCNDSDATQYPGGECTWTSLYNADLSCPTGAEDLGCFCIPADEDIDNVCNHVDQCPGEEDLLDANEDGIADCLE